MTLYRVENGEKIYFDDLHLKKISKLIYEVKRIISDKRIIGI